MPFPLIGLLIAGVAFGAWKVEMSAQKQEIETVPYSVKYEIASSTSGEPCAENISC